MKINKINAQLQRSFGQVFRCKLDTKNDTESVIATRLLDEFTYSKQGKGNYLIAENPYSSFLIDTFNNIVTEEGYSVNWLKMHTELRDRDLPNFIKTGMQNIYFLTEKDGKDYEKTFETRSKYHKDKREIREITNKYKELMFENPIDYDIFSSLDVNSKYQREFDEFLSTREIKDVKISDLIKVEYVDEEPKP